MGWQAFVSGSGAARVPTMPPPWGTCGRAVCSAAASSLNPCPKPVKATARAPCKPGIRCPATLIGTLPPPPRGRVQQHDRPIPSLGSPSSRIECQFGCSPELHAGHMESSGPCRPSGNRGGRCRMSAAAESSLALAAAGGDRLARPMESPCYLHRAPGLPSLDLPREHGALGAEGCGLVPRQAARSHPTPSTPPYTPYSLGSAPWTISSTAQSRRPR